MDSSIISEVCSLSGCTESEVISRSRKAKIVRARQILVSYNHLIEFKNQDHSGKEFNVNHSTVIHSIKTVQKDYSTSKEYRKLFSNFLELNSKILRHKFNTYHFKSNR